MREYKYELGIMVNNTPLPDPSELEYEVGDLDTSGSRDATGRLHRAWVAQKINYSLSWNGLEWEMLQIILGAINSDIFRLTAPDPRTFTRTYTADYYVGDRTGNALYYRQDSDEKAMFDLKLKFIEY